MLLFYKSSKNNHNLPRFSKNLSTNYGTPILEPSPTVVPLDVGNEGQTTCDATSKMMSRPTHENHCQTLSLNTA